MELCGKTLEDIIDEINEDDYLKTEGILTPIGYYIASQTFIEIFESVRYNNTPIQHNSWRFESMQYYFEKR